MCPTICRRSGPRHRQCGGRASAVLGETLHRRGSARGVQGLQGPPVRLGELGLDDVAEELLVAEECEQVLWLTAGVAGHPLSEPVNDFDRSAPLVDAGRVARPGLAQASLARSSAVRVLNPGQLVDQVTHPLPRLFWPGLLPGRGREPRVGRSRIIVVG